jgi:hypothetical protein
MTSLNTMLLLAFVLCFPRGDAFSAFNSVRKAPHPSYYPYPKSLLYAVDQNYNGNEATQVKNEQNEKDKNQSIITNDKEEPINQPTTFLSNSNSIEVSNKEEGTEKSYILQKMLMIASSTDRGQFASKEQKSSMAVLISHLETLNSSDNPAVSAPAESIEIQGTWELLYSDTQLFRSSPFFMAGRAVCQTEEDARKYDWFCDMHRAALAISEIGKVRQIISSERLVSEFEVTVGSIPFLSDFTPFRYSGGLPFTINGAIVSSADITPTNEGTAWEIFMDKVEIKGSNIPLLRAILDDERVALKSRNLGAFLEENVSGYKNPRPIFKTTYLDDSIRISRDQDGKVFVYGKMTDKTDPTEYKNVEADFGLLNILEGLNDNFFKFTI